MDAARDPIQDPLLRDLPTREGYKVLGRIVLYNTLGRGGFAVVYRGRHLALDVDVAAKCLKPDLAVENEQFVLRFQREAQQAARINHPNVVRVFDVDEADGVHYLVMEYVEGEDARTRVKRKGQLSVDEAVQIALEATRGLAEAHSAGLIHRDIKPDNILISGGGDVKLADLGLAKPADEEAGLTLSGQVMGTPQYMPPEQFKSLRDVGPSADVYSMGATLYYLLAGQEGIRGGSLFEVLERVKSEPFPDVRVRQPNVPNGLADLIALCTSKDPSERPQDGAELVRLLEASTSSTTRILEDQDTGSLNSARTLVSPPPAKTLNRIRVSLSAGEDAVDEAAAHSHRGGAMRWVAIVAVAFLVAAGVWWGFGGLGEESQASAFPDGELELAGEGESAGAQAAAGLIIDEPGSDRGTVAPAESGPTQAGKALDSVDQDTDESPQLADKGEESPADPPPAVSPMPLPVSLRLDTELADDGRLYTDEPAVVLKGHLSNPRTGRVELERTSGTQEQAIGQDGNFSLVVLLQPNRSETVVLRSEGLVDSVVLTLVHDDVEPKFLDPQAAELLPGRTRATSIDIVVAVEDQNLDSVSLPETPLELGGDGLWRAKSVPLPREGRNRLVLTARDRAGNTARIEKQCHRDTTSPKITQVDPPRGSEVVAGRTVEIVFEADESLERASLGALPGGLLSAAGERVVAGLDRDDRRASCSVEAPPRAGPWKPEVELFDLVGNSSVETLAYVVVDPKPTFLAPTGWTVHDPTPVDGWARRVEDPTTGVVFLRVPTGSFLIGSPVGEGGGDEHPRHRVTIAAGFYLAETELTQAQWDAVGTKRKYQPAFEGERRPVESVSWLECVLFCEEANRAAPGRYRLPSEAEWEYACRAGEEGLSFSSGSSLTTAQANISRHGDGLDDENQTVEVGRYPANGWGFHDMHGNVWEWCGDVYESAAYIRGVTQSANESGSSGYRVERGGSWGYPARYARSASRRRYEPGLRYRDLGLRPAFTPD